ncbi:MAG TPA: thioredoxin domain-containing protein [Gemmatimonadaceae bacterium]
MSRRTLSFVASALLGLLGCTRSDAPPEQTLFGGSAPLVGVAAWTQGPKDAPVVVEEYTDLECPFCARQELAHGDSLRAGLASRGDVRLVVYDLALPAHTHAATAALATRCAGEQGAYLRVRHLLSDLREQWARDGADSTLAYMAGTVVPSPTRLGVCLVERRAEALRALAANLERARSIGVDATPTLVVRVAGEVVHLSGITPPDSVLALIERMRSAYTAKRR